MLTIGLGPVFAGGGGGASGGQQGQTIFDLEFVTTTASAQVTDMSITEFPMVDTSKVTTMSRMFYGCASLQSVPELDTSKVTTMQSMFYGCASLQSVPELDTSKVTTMSHMFYGCASLQSVPELDTAKATQMLSVFNGCSALKEVLGLDLSSVNSTYLDGIFTKCVSLETCLIKNLKTILSFNDSPSLSKESVLYLFENAQTVTNSRKITLHADVFAQLTEDEIAIATEKGFSVVSA